MQDRCSARGRPAGARRRVAGLAATLLGVALIAPRSAGQPAPEGTRENPILFTIPDSLRSFVVVDSVLEFEAFEIRGRRISHQPEGGRDLIGLGSVERADAGSVAQLAPLLPSTHMTTNSRGEAVFSLRGSSERHVGVFWDDIPLTIPWDERVDLSLVPVDAVGGLRSQRGLRDLGAGPQILAGRVDLLPWRLAQPGHETRLSLGAGEVESYELRAAHARRSVDGRWNLLVAGGHRDSGGWLLPSDFAAPRHQDASRRTRLNSDLRTSSGLVSVRRLFGQDGEVRLLLLGSDSEKGVGPEYHVDDARFWRYPMVRRGLLGLSGHVHAGSARAWRLEFAASFDHFEQEIRSFDDASYSGPELTDGVDFEQDRDQTGYGKLALTRTLDCYGSITLTGVGRATQHRETLVVGGPEESYAQDLLSIVAEWSVPVGAGIQARIGGGTERASTPETGDKEGKDPTDAPLWIASLAREPEGALHWALRYSRRSRAPALRESFSGALGRFVVNPELGAEQQDLFELDLSRDYGQLVLSGALFASLLDGAIEREELPGQPNVFQRSNIDDLRVLGAEFGLQAALPQRFSGGLQFTALHARLREDGEFRGYAEDRPEFLSSSWLAWVHPIGLRARVENQSIGARASAGSNGLLAAQTQWNLRLAYLLFGGPVGLSETELFARVNNLLDAELWSQNGLPEPGRTLWVGARVKFR